MFYFKKYIYSFLLILLLTTFLSFDTKGHDTFILSLLHTNDLHGRALEFFYEPWDGPAGGLARIAAKAEDLRGDNPHTLLVDAGDLFSGTALCSLTTGRIMLAGASMAGYQAIAIGNHEWDYGKDLLHQYVHAQSASEFLLKGCVESQNRLGRFAPPMFLSANTYDNDGHLFAPSHLWVTVEDLRVLLVGLTTPTTRTAAHPDHTAGLRFRSPRLALSQLLDTVDRSFDLLIVLSHLGLDQDVILAESVPDIDVIVGGHTHRLLAEPIVVGDTIIVQAGSWGLYLGQLELTISERQVLSHQWILHALDASLPQDPLLLSMLDDCLAATAKDHNLDHVLGFTAEPLTRNPSWFVGDSMLGNLFTDAMRWKGAVDFAIYNNGGLRDDIPAGPISYHDLFRVEPFGSEIVLLELSGRQVDQVIQHMAGRGGEQVSGATFTVIGKTAHEIEMEGTPLNPDGMYTLAVSDFLAAGGSNYWMLPHVPRVGTAGGVREAITDFLAAHPGYTFTSNRRIRWSSP